MAVDASGTGAYHMQFESPEYSIPEQIGSYRGGDTLDSNAAGSATTSDPNVKDQVVTPNGTYRLMTSGSLQFCPNGGTWQSVNAGVEKFALTPPGVEAGRVLTLHFDGTFRLDNQVWWESTKDFLGTDQGIYRLANSGRLTYLTYGIGWETLNEGVEKFALTPPGVEAGRILTLHFDGTFRLDNQVWWESTKDFLGTDQGIYRLANDGRLTYLTYGIGWETLSEGVEKFALTPPGVEAGRVLTLHFDGTFRLDNQVWWESTKDFLGTNQGIYRLASNGRLTYLTYGIGWETLSEGVVKFELTPGLQAGRVFTLHTDGWMRLDNQEWAADTTTFLGTEEGMYRLAANGDLRYLPYGDNWSTIGNGVIKFELTPNLQAGRVFSLHTDGWMKLDNQNWAEATKDFLGTGQGMYRLASDGELRYLPYGGNWSTIGNGVVKFELTPGLQAGRVFTLHADGWMRLDNQDWAPATKDFLGTNQGMYRLGANGYLRYLPYGGNWSTLTGNVVKFSLTPNLQAGRVFTLHTDGSLRLDNQNWALDTKDFIGTDRGLYRLATNGELRYLTYGANWQTSATSISRIGLSSTSYVFAQRTDGSLLSARLNQPTDWQLCGLGGLSKTSWAVLEPGYLGTITVAGGRGTTNSLSAYNLPTGLHAALATDQIMVDGSQKPASGNYTFTVSLSLAANIPWAILTRAYSLQIVPRFNIQLVTTGMTSSQQNIFQQAANRWENVIIGDLPDLSVNGQWIDDVRIDARSMYIDGVFGILGQAGPTVLRPASKLPAAGTMQFDSADLAQLESQGSLLSVVLHEIGHVLGIGSIWSELGLLAGRGTTNPRFIGPNATAEYRRLSGENATGVPVESGGGPGTADAHWRESTFGNELMTGYLNLTTNPLSRLTIASLQDMGYTVNYAAAEAYTLPGSQLPRVTWDDTPGDVLTGSSVVGRNLFYNQSYFDGANASINDDDDLAIAIDKVAYLPGNGMADFSSVTSYSRGINGIMIDLAGGGDHTAINADDFVFKVGNNNAPDTWGAAPEPSIIVVRTGAGVGGSDRIEITWANNAIKNQWLEVNVLAGANTGLVSNDVFYWGSRVGDTGFGTPAGTFVTSAADKTTVIGHFGANAPLTDLLDFNRDGAVTGADATIATNSFGSITRLNIQAVAAIGGNQALNASSTDLDACATACALNQTTASSTASFTTSPLLDNSTGNPTGNVGLDGASQEAQAAVVDMPTASKVVFEGFDFLQFDEVDFDEGLLDLLSATGLSQ